MFLICVWVQEKGDVLLFLCTSVKYRDKHLVYKLSSLKALLEPPLIQHIYEKEKS